MEPSNQGGSRASSLAHWRWGELGHRGCATFAKPRTRKCIETTQTKCYCIGHYLGISPWNAWNPTTFSRPNPTRPATRQIEEPHAKASIWRQDHYTRRYFHVNSQGLHLRNACVTAFAAIFSELYEPEESRQALFHNLDVKMLHVFNQSGRMPWRLSEELAASSTEVLGYELSPAPTTNMERKAKHAATIAASESKPQPS